jgi:hypothetical protein
VSNTKAPVGEESLLQATQGREYIPHFMILRFAPTAMVDIDDFLITNRSFRHGKYRSDEFEPISRHTPDWTKFPHRPTIEPADDQGISEDRVFAES